ncbi:MAG: hypothetical protein M1834_003117 [Cirrosporium novae-zelandiae]|nr:MAG: hypothetical protein M1834_003117 [Cirrosporium novae-zelandiae]
MPYLQLIKFNNTTSPLKWEKMSSLLRTIKSTFTPTSSRPASPPNIFSSSSAKTFSKAPNERSLFPPVDPSIDGPDCLQSCQTCTIHLPKSWSIDEEEQLYGRVNGWATQLLVATGKTDWVRDVAEEEDGKGVLGTIQTGLNSGEFGEEGKLENGKMLLSASNMPLPDSHYDSAPITEEKSTSVLLLPSMTFINHVTPSTVPDMLRFISSQPTTTTPVSAPHPTFQTLSPPLVPRKCPHRAVILLCSHRTRDARCGQSAPLLKKEFERHLRHYGLYRDAYDERPGGVAVYFISHVGGHKFAANVIIYRRGEEWKIDSNEKVIGGEGEEEATQGIWLGRIRPEDCEGLIKYTVLKGKVIKPERQLRGGFDRGKGVISW